MSRQRQSPLTCRPTPVSNSRRRLTLEQLEPRFALAAILAQWTGGSGSWWDASHWDIGVVPHNANGITYAAVIGAAEADAVITVDRDLTIDSLTNAANLELTARGDLLGTIRERLDNQGRITILGGAANSTLQLPPGTIQNRGILSVRGSRASLLAVADTVLEGTGEVFLSQGGVFRTAVGRGADLAQLRIGPDQVIAGDGQVIAHVRNEGVVQANAVGRPLLVGTDPSAVIENSGTISATNGSTIQLVGQSVSNQGTIETRGPRIANIAQSVDIDADLIVDSVGRLRINAPGIVRISGNLQGNTTNEISSRRSGTFRIRRR